MATSKSELRARLKAAEDKAEHQDEQLQSYRAKDAALNRKIAVVFGFTIGLLFGLLIWGWLMGFLLGALLAAVLWVIVSWRQSASRRSSGSHRDSGSEPSRGDNGFPWRLLGVAMIIILISLNTWKYFTTQAAEPEVQAQQSVQTPISTDPNVEPTMVATDECTTQAIKSFMALGGARASDGEVAIGDEVDWAESGTKPDAVEYLFGKAQQNNMLVGDPDMDLYVPVQVLKNPLTMEVDEADGRRVEITMQPWEVMWAYADSCFVVQENTLHLGERTGAYFDD